MIERRKSNYFYTGLFFLSALALIVIAIMLFSSKFLWQKVIHAETYFNESVEGLSKGSTVKYLGMEIGKIDKIATIDNIYHIAKEKDIQQQKAGKYIYVKMTIYPVFFSSSTKNFGEELNKMVANGLRAKLSFVGLTGAAYINMDFVQNPIHKVLPISWKPENYYIPSVPSTLSYFSDNVQYLLQELTQIDLKGLVNSTQQFIGAANQTATNANKLVVTANSQAEELMSNLNAVSHNVKQISEQMRTSPAMALFSGPPKKLDLKKL